MWLLPCFYPGYGGDEDFYRFTQFLSSWTLLPSYAKMPSLLPYPHPLCHARCPAQGFVRKGFSSRCFAPLRPSAPLALAPRFRFERSSPAVVVLPPRAQIADGGSGRSVYPVRRPGPRKLTRTGSIVVFLFPGRLRGVDWRRHDTHVR